MWQEFLFLIFVTIIKGRCCSEIMILTECYGQQIRHIQYFSDSTQKDEEISILEGKRKRGDSSSQQLFETGPVCFCLSQVPVIVSCFCHFWNDNSESLGCFPVQFLDAHMLTEKQTEEERGWTLVADVRRRPELECTTVVLFMCLTLFILMCSGICECTLKTEICIDQQIHSCLVTKNLGNSSPLFNILCSEPLFEFPVIHWRGMNTAAPSAVHSQLYTLRFDELYLQVVKEVQYIDSLLKLKLLK